MTYKKLSDVELKELYANLQGYFGVPTKYGKLISLVNEYFVNPTSILLDVDSEYNDSTYDNKVISVYVYGEHDIEIPLTQIDRQKFSVDVRGVLYNLVPDETNDPLESVVIYVKKELPEIYIKEK